jgi:hypothetical protein
MVSIFDPRTLIGVWEQVKRAKSFLRQFAFSREFQSTTEYIDLDEVKQNRIMAPFSALEGDGSAVARTGFNRNSYTPPKTAPRVTTTAKDLQSVQPGENIYQGLTPGNRDLMQIMRDMEMMDNMIVRREEWMCAQLLFTGQVAMVGVDYSETLTFGHTAAEALSGGNRWSESTAVPLTNLGTWALSVAKDTGVIPTSCLMALDVWGDFITNAEVQASLDVTKQGMSRLAPRDIPDGAKFMGSFMTIAGMIDVYLYPEWFEDVVGGVLTRYPMIPNGKVCLLNPSDSFVMAHGAYIDLETEPATTYIADRYPRSWYEKGPNQRFLQLVSRPLVAPTRTNAWFIGTVHASA